MHKTNKEDQTKNKKAFLYLVMQMSLVLVICQGEGFEPVEKKILEIEPNMGLDAEEVNWENMLKSVTKV